MHRHRVVNKNRIAGMVILLPDSGIHRRDKRVGQDRHMKRWPGVHGFIKHGTKVDQGTHAGEIIHG